VVPTFFVGEEHNVGQDPTVTQYRIENLYDAFERLEKQMREGFADIKRILDERLESRDRFLQDHEKRIQALELRLARQQAINAILSTIGGISLAGVVSWILNRVLNGSA